MRTRALQTNTTCSGTIGEDDSITLFAFNEWIDNTLLYKKWNTYKARKPNLNFSAFNSLISIEISTSKMAFVDSKSWNSFKLMSMLSRLILWVTKNKNISVFYVQLSKIYGFEATITTFCLCLNLKPTHSRNVRNKSSSLPKDFPSTCRLYSGSG